MVFYDYNGNEYNFDFIESVEKMFDPLNCCKKQDVISEVAKQFQKYKYPVDYIYEYTKNGSLSNSVGEGQNTM